MVFVNIQKSAGNFTKTKFVKKLIVKLENVSLDTPKHVDIFEILDFVNSVIGASLHTKLKEIR